MLQMMFSVQVPTNKDKFKNKHVLTYFHWYGASSALKWNLTQQDVNTGQWFSPTAVQQLDHAFVRENMGCLQLHDVFF